MMTGMKMRHGLSLPLVLCALTACGHSRVVRAPTPARHAAERPPTSTPSPIRQSQPKYGATAVVRPGQTVYRIATENGITALDLALWNDIPPPYTIHPGQSLRLYPREVNEAPPRAPVPAKTPVPRPVTPASSRPAPKAPASAAPATTVEKPATATPAAPLVSALAWRWPAEGTVVSGFSSGDPTRQGIDIAGKAGQPVRAAADGVVVYSGSGLVGYGELVIIKHNDQWLSAYGHNRARLVNEGVLVKAGQQIAEMGRSGATRDMLHFEIRHNGKPVDPKAWLPEK